MAVTLTGAIKTCLAANAAVTAIVGQKIWLEQAPEGSGLPLIVIYNGRSQVDWCFGSKSIVNSELLVECYAVSAQAADALKDAATDAIDPYVATYGNSRIMCCLRETEDIAIEQDRSPTGNPVFKTTAKYMIKVEVG